MRRAAAADSWNPRVNHPVLVDGRGALDERLPERSALRAVARDKFLGVSPDGRPRIPPVRRGRAARFAAPRARLGRSGERQLSAIPPLEARAADEEPVELAERSAVRALRDDERYGDALLPAGGKLAGAERPVAPGRKSTHATRRHATFVPDERRPFLEAPPHARTMERTPAEEDSAGTLGTEAGLRGRGRRARESLGVVVDPQRVSIFGDVAWGHASPAAEEDGIARSGPTRRLSQEFSAIS